MDGNKRVAIYARVSTDEQTIESQLAACRDFCERKGWPAAQEFADDGVSGDTVSRKSLDEMMALVRRHKFDVLLVWKYDRFARSTVQLILALDELKGLNVDYVSVADHIDTTTAVGRFMYTINAGYAEMELATIRQRSRAGIEYALKRGVKFGRAGWKTKEGILSQDKIERIRALAGCKTQRQIAVEVGVGKGTVYRVLKSRPVNTPQNVEFAFDGVPG